MNKRKGIAFLVNGEKPSYRNNMFLAALQMKGFTPILFLRKEIDKGTDTVIRAESDGMTVFTVKILGGKGSNKRYGDQLKKILARIKGSTSIVIATHLDHLLFLRKNKQNNVSVFYDLTEKSVTDKKIAIKQLNRAANFTMRTVEERILKSIDVKGISLDGSMGENKAKYAKICSRVSRILTVPPATYSVNEEDAANIKKNLSGKRVIAALGDFSNWDDLSDAVEVATNVISCYDDVFFLFIGKTGLERDTLNETLASNDIKGRAIFLEGLSYGKIMAYLENCHVGLVFYSGSPGAKNSFDDLSMRIFSLMQAGLPVVASSESETSDVVKLSGCGLLVDTSSSVEFASAVSYMLTSPDKAKLSGEKGLNAFKNSYCWEKEEEKLTSMLR
ncbi:MAG: glycosyltransferase [bacterium]|nr:glycosyltransferase [bacterium]